jgi:hypothetical protein
MKAEIHPDVGFVSPHVPTTGEVHNATYRVSGVRQCFQFLFICTKSRNEVPCSKAWLALSINSFCLAEREKPWSEFFYLNRLRKVDNVLRSCFFKYNKAGSLDSTSGFITFVSMYTMTTDFFFWQCWGSNPEPSKCYPSTQVLYHQATVSALGFFFFFFWQYWDLNSRPYPC